MTLPYEDRTQAGRELAELVRQAVGDRDDLLVLGLPRGGVPVAFEVARALGAPLDLMLVRKLGFPGQEELAMGAIATGGMRVLNDEVVGRGGVDAATIEAVTRQEQAELRRREWLYRGNRPEVDVAGRCVILVDDGLATGSTMLAAVRALRQRQGEEAPGRIVVAVPVAPPETIASLREEVDELICPATPDQFGGVGRWYRNFTQTTDEQVRQFLGQAWRRESA
ncbi:MAG: phosphoribosyltransferase [Phycisphaeraceae bacterium]